MATKKKYTIYFGIEKKNSKESSEVLEASNFSEKESFIFFDYDSKQSIKNLKEYFLSSFGYKYKYCTCLIDLFKLNSGFLRDRFNLVKDDELKKLSELNTDVLYLIKRNGVCKCEDKITMEYLLKSKSELISDLKKYKDTNDIISDEKEKLQNSNIQLEKAVKELQERINVLEKKNEINNYLAENFYDVIIDIKSIKGITKGWKIKMTEKGKKIYQEYKNKECLRIGVIGNSNKGKSFLLSKISKIDLLTGTSIQTEGLSIKYPDTHLFKNRHLILLDSAGLETPVLKNANKENEEIKIENNEKQENDYSLFDKNDNILEKNENNENNENIDNEEKKEEININNDVKKNENEKNENNKKKEEEDEIDLDDNENYNEIEKKSIEEIKDFKERARDKIMTEIFLQNFIISNSDILLLVVGILTYSEQLLINKIKQICKNMKRDQPFIIVHNLQSFRTIPQVENYIQNTLLKCSTLNLKKHQVIDIQELNENIEKETDRGDNDKGEEKKNEDEESNNNDEINNIINGDSKDNNEKYNQEGKDIAKHFKETLFYDKSTKLIINHLILANEDSEAGKIYNKYSYKYIENIYNNSPQKQFDIIDKVKKMFKSMAETILKNKIKGISFNSNQDILKNKVIKLDIKEKEIQLKKCYIDELGFSFFKTGDFEPKYNYFKLDEKTLEIRLELPGNCTANVEYSIEKEVTRIKVYGTKKHDKDPKNFEDNIFNMREFSNYEVNISLPTDTFRIASTKPKEGYPKIAKGVCIIQYELSEEGEKASVTNNEEDI